MLQGVGHQGLPQALPGRQHRPLCLLRSAAGTGGGHVCWLRTAISESRRGASIPFAVSIPPGGEHTLDESGHGVLTVCNRADTRFIQSYVPGSKREWSEKRVPGLKLRATAGGTARRRRGGPASGPPTNCRQTTSNMPMGTPLVVHASNPAQLATLTVLPLGGGAVWVWARHRRPLALSRAPQVCQTTCWYEADERRQAAFYWGLHGSCWRCCWRSLRHAALAATDMTSTCRFGLQRTPLPLLAAVAAQSSARTCGDNPQGGGACDEQTLALPAAAEATCASPPSPHPFAGVAA